MTPNEAMDDPVLRALIDRDDTRLTDDLVLGYLDRGEWVDRRVDQYLWDAADSRPDHVALVGHDVDAGTRRTLTYAEYARAVTDLATGLHAVGVRPGDVVTVMLPNTVEFAVAIMAIARLGAVYSGIPMAYGRREVSFMLRRTGSQVLLVPGHHRGRDQVPLLAEILDGIPMGHIIIVGATGALPSAGPRWLGIEDLLDEGRGVSLPDAPSAMRLCHVGFTSGTTGEPKGVMNTHQTLDAILRRWIDHIGTDVLGQDTVNLIASPIGHHTGFLWGVLLSALVQGTGVLVDRWIAGAAAQTIADEGVTLLIGAAPFLQDLLGVADARAGRWDSLRVISIPGAPIPRGLVPRARRALGCAIVPAWGMTEYGIGLSGSPTLPQERVDATDGVPVEGCAVRIVGPDGQPATAGTEGDLEITGAGLFLGYLDRPDFTAEAVVDGWLRTGDRAVQDDDGFVSLVGRTKDIIIRGGENIPVAQVESLLHEHPAIADAVLVAMPDERLGERACACVVVRTGAPVPTFEDVTDFLRGLGLSTHFLPERLEVLDELPRTMSGKVRKTELRTWVADRLQQMSDKENT